MKHQFARKQLVRFGLSFAMGLSAVATAQEHDTLTQTYTRAYESLSHGRYLEAVDMLRPLALDQRGGVRDVKAFNLWNQSQVDVSGEPHRLLGSSAAEEDPALVKQLTGATTQPAISTIVRYARSTRIVILNEDHIHPRQRAFALEVARALRPLGYNILALEALNNRGDPVSRTSALRRRGYVVWDDGFYLHDPVFADFVRQALQLGYAPASYEDVTPHNGSDDERFAAREQGEAQNLAKIIAEHPSAKLLVYVGQSHLAERPLGEGTNKQTWMAARLTRLTGLDPLTIDQSTLEEGCVTCARIAKQMKKPVVFFHASRPLITGQYAGAVDLQVFKPSTERIAGRPGWLLEIGREPFQVPRNLLPTSGSRLVQAFVASDSADAVPVDQFIVTAGQRPPEFMLPSARMRFAFQEP